MNYVIVVLVFIIGLFIVLASKNLIKKIIGLGIFQTAILLFYVSLGKVNGGKPPIIDLTKIGEVGEIFVSPVPQVLMLTAIVVGIATLAVAMAFIVKIKQNFETIEEDKILDKLNKDEFPS